jgi:predicted nucleic acid-binding protein
VTLVVDTSVVIKWIVREEDSDLAVDLVGLIPTAPDLLRAELANVLATKVRTGQMTVEQALAAQAVNEAAINFLPSMDFARRALELALELRHPAYDCFYLALAESIDAVLITADKRLVDRCKNTAFQNRIRSLA